MRQRDRHRTECGRSISQPERQSGRQVDEYTCIHTAGQAAYLDEVEGTKEGDEEEPEPEEDEDLLVEQVDGEHTLHGPSGIQDGHT